MGSRRDRKDNKSGEGQWIVIKGRGSSGRTIKPELNDGIDYVIER